MRLLVQFRALRDFWALLVHQNARLVYRFAEWPLKIVLTILNFALWSPKIVQ